MYLKIRLFMFAVNTADCHNFAASKIKFRKKKYIHGV